MLNQIKYSKQLKLKAINEFIIIISKIKNYFNSNP